MAMETLPFLFNQHPGSLHEDLLEDPRFPGVKSVKKAMYAPGHLNPNLQRPMPSAEMVRELISQSSDSSGAGTACGCGVAAFNGARGGKKQRMAPRPTTGGLGRSSHPPTTSGATVSQSMLSSKLIRASAESGSDLRQQIHQMAILREMGDSASSQRSQPHVTGAARVGAHAASVHAIAARQQHNHHLGAIGRRREMFFTGVPGSELSNSGRMRRSSTDIVKPEKEITLPMLPHPPAVPRSKEGRAPGRRPFAVRAANITSGGLSFAARALGVVGGSPKKSASSSPATKRLRAKQLWGVLQAHVAPGPEQTARRAQNLCRLREVFAEKLLRAAIKENRHVKKISKTKRLANNLSASGRRVARGLRF